MASRVIAIDGPAGSGKSTTARAVADQLNLAHLDSGALYRAITLVALEGDVPLDGPLIVRAANERGVELRDVSGNFHAVRAGADVSKEIRSSRVTSHVSAVSALPAVRDWANAVFRAAVARHSRGVVAEGRDIGTVVFPDAMLKVFLTASLGERAKRRARELGGEEPSDLQRVSDDLTRRDEADSSRKVAPLVAAPDAVHLDTTDLTVEGQVAAVVAHAARLFGSGSV